MTAREPLCLILVALLLATAPAASPAQNATGHYDTYCDGVGLFLANVDGAPAPGKLVLFLYLGWPGGTFGNRHIGQGIWSDVFVFSNGCVPDGKCDSMAHGKVWIDAWDTELGDTAPKRISGQYEIDLNGKHLEGKFVAKQHRSKRPLRLCM